MATFFIDFDSIWKFFIQFKSRFMSDPTLFDINFKNKIAWVWSLDFELHLKACKKPVPEIRWVFRQEEYSSFRHLNSSLFDKL